MSLCKSKAQKRIAFVSFITSHGGSIKMMTWLANELSQCFSTAFINISGMEVYYPIDKRVQLYNVDRNAWRRDLYNILQREKYDLIVSFGDHAVYELAILRPIFNYKLLVSQRSSVYPHMRLQDYVRLNIIFALSDGIVTQTKMISNYFDRGFTKRVRKYIIPNPMKGKGKEWAGNSNKRIICVARIDMKQKRHDILLESMQLVVKRYPDAKLFFFGEEKDNGLEVLSGLIADKNLQNNVFYCGVTNNVEDELCKSDLQVLCSDFEGIPNSLIEGICVGIPIIATDFYGGGARLLLGQNGEYGTIVERGSSLGMAQKIIEYFDDRADFIKKAQDAKENAKKYSEEKIIQMWRETIEDVTL